MIGIEDELKKIRDKEDKLKRSAIERSVIFTEDTDGNKRFIDFKPEDGPDKVNFENLRTSDPASPKNGQSWIRIDLIK